MHYESDKEEDGFQEIKHSIDQKTQPSALERTGDVSSYQELSIDDSSDVLCLSLGQKQQTEEIVREDAKVQPLLDLHLLNSLQQRLSLSARSHVEFDQGPSDEIFDDKQQDAQITIIDQGDYLTHNKESPSN